MGLGQQQAPPAARRQPAPKVPAPRAIDSDATVLYAGTQITHELREVIEERIAPGYKFALPRAGIASLDQVAGREMS